MLRDFSRAAHITAGISMTTANSSTATTDIVTDPFTQAEVSARDDIEMERVQAHLIVCVYARDAAGIRAIFAQHNADRLIGSLRKPRYFPVHEAAGSDNSAVLGALIDVLPADVLNVRDDSGRTPLMCAAEQGQLNAIHKLLASKAAVGMTDNAGCSALMRAAASGATDAVKILLGYEVYATNGDDQPMGINRQDHKGDTALMLAIRAGHYEVVRALVARGASIDIANADGEQALSLAASLGRCRVVRLLCEQPGVDLNAADHQGITAVMHATDYADRAYDPSILNLLLGYNVRTDLKDHHGCTALLRAAKGQSDVAIEHLIAGWADIHATDSEGCSALTLAVKHRNAYGLRFLSRQPGVWIDARDHRGCTPLSYAVDAGDCEIVDELIQRGASVNLLYGERNETVLALAQRSGNQRMVDLLLANGARREIPELIELAG